MPVAIAANALTNLASVKAELGIATGDTSQDDFLTRAINSASALIERYCNRPFSYAAAEVEKLAGYGTTRLVVKRTPLKTITSIAFDGATILATDYAIEDAEAGFIFRRTGWLWTASNISGVVYAPYPGSEEKLYQVTYAGGYVTPAQVDAAPVPPPPAPVRDLPYDLEDAAIRLAVQRYHDKGSELGISSESLMSYSVSYGGKSVNGIPEEIATLLNGYAREAFA